MSITISLYVCAEVQSDTVLENYWENTDAYRTCVVSLDENDPDEAVRQVEKAAKQAGLDPTDLAEMGATIRNILAKLEEG